MFQSKFFAKNQGELKLIIESVAGDTLSHFSFFLNSTSTCSAKFDIISIASLKALILDFYKISTSDYNSLKAKLEFLNQLREI
jgi:hypothetical protein